MESQTTNHSGDRAFAVLALALDDPPAPQGPRPTVDEIYDWHYKKLAEPRASEVGTYVARDHECSEIWADLLDADASAPVSVPDSTRSEPNRSSMMETLKEWLGSAFSPPRLAAGAVAMLALLLGVNQLMQPDLHSRLDRDIANMGWDGPVTAEVWPATGGWTPKSQGDSDASRTAQLAFAVGVREQLGPYLGKQSPWTNVIATLPNTLPACAEGDGECRDAQSLLQDAGRWTSAVFLRCQVSPGDVARLAGGRERVEQLAEALRAYPPAANIAATYRQWLQAPDDEFCAEAGGMLAKIKLKNE